jgi:hypothetical protein
MRYIIFFTFYFFSLYAKSSDACYSVSLLSVADTQYNKEALLKNKYPLASCKIMSISDMLTVRCGCFEKMSEARQSTDFIKKRYKYPVQIVPTYRYRFAEPKKLQNKPVEVKKRVQKQKQRVAVKTKKVVQPVLKTAVPTVQKEIKPKPLTSSQRHTESLGHIDLTLLARYLSNEEFYKHSPYYFALVESDYQGDDYSIYGGLGFQSKEENEVLLINHLYGEYFGDDYTFKIGKMVQKIGVMDYFSILDTVNPSREEFFDDSQLEIKKIPLWMSSIDYFIQDTVKLTAFIQPYDAKHQNYTGPYVNYLLYQFIPQYYKDFFAQEPLGKELLYPLYRDSLVPYIKNDVQNKSAKEQIYWDKLSYGFVSEYSNDNLKIGALYCNRYSEIPMIKIDQNLLNAALAYDNGENPSADLANYIESGDYDLIKSVQEFRYQQFGLYGETTVHSFGLRTELGYRDKVPVFNEYSGLISAGGAIDYLASSVYNAFEMQYIYLEKYQKSAYIAMLRTRFSKQMLWRFSWYFENSLLAAQVDTFNEYSIAPNLTISYKQIDLSLQGIVSQKNVKTNTLSILLRGRF